MLSEIKVIVPAMNSKQIALLEKQVKEGQLRQTSTFVESREVNFRAWVNEDKAKGRLVIIGRLSNGRRVAMVFVNTKTNH